MKIVQVNLHNFKGIESAKFDIGGQSAVFFGINGVGKSTVLRGINLLFSNIINRIVQNRYKQGINIETNDVTFGETLCSIEADFVFDDGTLITYDRSFDKRSPKKRQIIKGLNEFSEKFSDLYLYDAEHGMPIFVNYGVNRSVLDVPLRIKISHQFDRLSALENAIESKIDFRVFFEWFRYQEDIENQIKVQSQDLNYVDIPLKSVKYAISEMLDGLTNIRVERNPLAMKADKNGMSLRIEQLSDGVKCTLALFGDLARRLSIANINSSDPLKGQGVVLIDEIELHMHTTWQRKVLSSLRKVFPNIQFFITTHSPQVLGELDDSFKVFSLSTNQGKLNYCNIKPFGLDTNLILEELMNTSSVNIEIKDLTKKMFSFIDSNNYDEALNIADKIDRLTSKTNEDTVKARILIARRKAK